MAGGALWVLRLKLALRPALYEFTLFVLFWLGAFGHRFDIKLFFSERAEPRDKKACAPMVSIMALSRYFRMSTA
jgi:hypothetical protein